MLKMIGLIALVAAAGFAGVQKSAELKERIRLLEDFLKMMLDLKSRIDYFKQPLLPMFQQTSAKKNTVAYRLLDRCQNCGKNRAKSGVSGCMQRKKPTERHH